MSDNYKKIQNYFEPQYDSDEDLSAEDRKKVKESSSPDETRKAAWEKADLYPKIKKVVKGAWYGDKNE